MTSKPNVYKGLLTKRPKTPFCRQNQLVNQHEPPFIELRGAHFLLSEATALVEVASPLSEVQINCEQFSHSPMTESPCVSVATELIWPKLVIDLWQRYQSSPARED